MTAARNKRVPDVIVPGLRVLLVGINPGLYSAAVGHHFARPGNRFWPTLHAAGITPRLLRPAEERELLALGYGISNIADRASATADELSAEELVRGARRLRAKVGAYQPAYVAFLGVTAYRTAFGQPRAKVGRQEEMLEASRIWVLPNPSGLNAHYQLADLARMFQELRLAAEVGPASRAGPGSPGAARLAAPTVGPASRAGPGSPGAARLAAPTIAADSETTPKDQQE
jgi:TDG/mug DNA glycosylase family protein